MIPCIKKKCARTLEFRFLVTRVETPETDPSAVAKKRNIYQSRLAKSGDHNVLASKLPSIGDFIISQARGISAGSLAIDTA